MGSSVAVKQHLQFNTQPQAPDRKTPIVDITNLADGAYIGQIRWHGAWRQFTLWPDEDTIWSHDCLDEVVTELRRLNAEQRAKVKARKVNKQ
jgi:hypothetical protein